MKKILNFQKVIILKYGCVQNSGREVSKAQELRIGVVCLGKPWQWSEAILKHERVTFWRAFCPRGVQNFNCCDSIAPEMTEF